MSVVETFLGVLFGVFVGSTLGTWASYHMLK